MPQAKHLPHIPWLDKLRPPSGWVTRFAVLSAYSAHTSVVGAALLALAGEDEDASSRVAFARALQQLRGKVHVLFQSGRLTCPASNSAAVALLDRHLIAVDYPEATAEGYSWHAKFALVRHENPDGEHEGRWVFALGSRNLTLDLSWDLALAMQSSVSASANAVAGVAGLAEFLSDNFPELAGLKKQIPSLRKERWAMQDGYSVEEVRLLPPLSNYGFPPPPLAATRCVAISPFLDKGALKDFQRWHPDGRVELLSTRQALAKAALPADVTARMKLRVMAECDFSEELEDKAVNDASLSIEQVGLHAKALFAETPRGFRLTTGSPNLTQRAWTRNAECFVTITAAKPYSPAAKAILEGLEMFLALSTQLEVADLGAAAPDSSVEEVLSQARAHISTALANARQFEQKGLVMIDAGAAPHGNGMQVRLACAPVDGAFADWEPGLSSIVLLEGSRSECVRCRISLDETSLTWVQVISWEPKLGLERDDEVLGAYLGPRQFLAWMHQVLHGYADNDEGGEWHEPAGVERRAGTRRAGLPSVEQAIRLWLKEDRPRLAEISRILSIWNASASRRKAGDQERSDAEFLDQFARSWGRLREALKL
jgi:hypothetical protein